MMSASIRLGDVFLGKYRVERELGQGGMGVVVAARHLELDELFAIKLLLPEALAQPQAIERFLREARAAARLKSEHVAKVHDVGRLESGAPYMVMEHLDGVDLSKIVRTNGPFPVREAAALLLQACDALAEAHDRGIIHRDLKPANLFLVQRPNGSPCLKVLDFGISKHTAPVDAGLTRSGEILGSPLYMSPEQMARMKDADARADIWAMGVILFELVTGTTPFVGDTLTEVVARVLQEEPPPPSRLRADVPGWVDAIVLRCLKKRPDERYASIRELEGALRGGGATAELPVLQAPERASAATLEPASLAQSARGRESAARRDNRTKGKVLAAAGMAAGLLAVGAIALWLQRPAPSASADTAIPSQREGQRGPEAERRSEALLPAASESSAEAAPPPPPPAEIERASSSPPLVTATISPSEKPGGASGAKTQPALAARKGALGQFNQSAAASALSAAAASAQVCSKYDGLKGTGRVKVTFDSTGKVTSVLLLSGPFSGSKQGLCISGYFRSAAVPPFDGPQVSVSKNFTIQ
jgi:serine/threonine-protein kinase